MSALSKTRLRALSATAFACLLFTTAAFAQKAEEDHSKHDHSQHGQQKPAAQDDSQHGHQRHAPEGDKKAAPQKSKAPAQKKSHSGHGAAPRTAHSGHDGHTAKPQADHSGHDQHDGMKGFLGPYAMTREGSGTSWVPDTTPHEGIHNRFGDWSTMWHMQMNFVYDKQGGPRGDKKAFASGMIMGMAQRPLGDGTFGLRAMLSPDPLMGKGGYPLLLASGETADGRTHLIDRQHPHDLFMELAAIYSRPISSNASVFLYAGLPGEPALGPPAFMHRTSGVDNPEAPITHHWLDSTHITWGVVTGGVIVDKWKFEASGFRGRESDQYRYDIEAPKLDSYSARLSWNPVRELSMQVSWGRINSPEQLAPTVDEERTTASATYTQPFGQDNLWSTTAAWGRKTLRPGDTLDGFLLESALVLKKTYTLFMRAERVAETELHHDEPPLRDRILMVNKLSVGGVYDFKVAKNVKFGVGALVSKYVLPSELKPLYGSDPTSSMVFARLKVQ